MKKRRRKEREREREREEGERGGGEEGGFTSNLLVTISLWLTCVFNCEAGT